MGLAAARALPALLAVVLLAGCAGHDPAGPTPEQELSAQRQELRTMASTLLSVAADAVTGAVTTGVGGWRPCDERFPEGFDGYQYLIRARVDPGQDFVYSPLLAIEPALRRAGWRPRHETVAGSTVPVDSLRLARGGLGVLFYQSGEARQVMLTASGPCVDVPGKERPGWLGRPDPEAELPVVGHRAE